MRITSTQNRRVQYVRSLERSHVRQREGVYLVEGVRLVDEALSSHQKATIALYDPELLKRSARGSKLLDALPNWTAEGYEVDERVLAAASQTETPAGIIAVLQLPETEPLASHEADRFGLLLDQVADPGNVGTILRTADAAGVDYVVAMAGSADLYAPKVVRAGMGAHFRLPLYRGLSWGSLRIELPATTLVGIEAQAQHSIYDFPWPRHTGLVVGNEAHGFSGEARALLSQSVRVPMRSGVESLNVAVAASLVIYSVFGMTISSSQ